jgi:hypothetical protein
MLSLLLRYQLEMQEEPIYIAMFDVDINLGYLKKTDTFLNQNANLMVSF